MFLSRFPRPPTVLVGLFLLGCSLAVARTSHAQGCQVLRYTFQPDCFRAATDTACATVFYRNDSGTSVVDHLDLGPQIAVWIESADRTQFIDTLMVTNQVAARGIGNRPGLAFFVSSPRFPYGKRQMALPIWAYARGVTYPSVVFQDGSEDRIGFHESCSSPDPFYCRPMTPTDIVDAITCPSAAFNSSKGRIDKTRPRSYYPPRNDLGSDPRSFIARDCDALNASLDTCTVSSEGYSLSNDLDAVAAATPAYGQAYTNTWNIPANLAPGNYAVWVEVNKEFDVNAYHSYVATRDLQSLGAYGLSNNFGQPSVVYRVPIRIDGANAASAAQSQIEGYSDWRGESGTVLPRDRTISGDPGSGEGRLLQITGPTGLGRVHVSLEQCTPVVCDPPPPAPLTVSDLHVGDGDLTATTAQVHFLNASAGGVPVRGYEVRYRATAKLTMSVDEFLDSNSAPQVQPGLPNAAALVMLEGLKPATHYVVGIRSQGPCMGQSELAVTDFTTPTMKFTQLSGCFIATAAYGSEMAPEVAALRSARDGLRPRSALVAAAIELYYRSGPAAAAVIGRSETARALARRLIAPLAEIAEIAQNAQNVGNGQNPEAPPPRPVVAKSPLWR